MITVLYALISLLSFRLRSRASLELELIALRHQVTVLRRQYPSRPKLFRADRLLWVWLYRIWPQALHTMVLVKPATVIQWHSQGLPLGHGVICLGDDIHVFGRDQEHAAYLPHVLPRRLLQALHDAGGEEPQKRPPVG